MKAIIQNQRVQRTWVYQMSEAKWSRDDFLHEIQNSHLQWPHYKIKGQGLPAAEDTLILFYAPTGSEFPGICGQGVIERFHPRSKKITFQVDPMTKRLSERPWWDGKAKKLLDEIRGRPPRATLFSANRKQAAAIHFGVQKWLRQTQ